MELLDRDITGRIIGCAYCVHGTLGAGFLEKVYANAMCIELKQNGLGVIQSPTVAVRYRGQVIGEYVPDLLVESRVICELKAVERLLQIHEVQLVNYLVATGLDTGLLINFGGSVSVRRKFRRYRAPVDPANPVNLVSR
jgi:GxxExxY protein